ncbi:alpha/beta fold hydrolase [Natrialbaceae archaeon AArc-T1-2]|uniref:alpha/beta fold hydrolase n=1 Tax=Natrialbaceae archaeon AArc-T1-2 TaxID=3053904 RepID=UPI00255B2168|nr:alpha/beta hydrolase [Natrialbaceae archaeon AArc-T1-2]WIV66533.1 alpha/beta hydrolase [Natrialbaceae archaeon AArc-T1-2]
MEDTPTREAGSTVGPHGKPTADVDELVTHGQTIANGVRLHYVAAGPEDGPPVVLLHGFPEFWYTWREQLPALAAAGYRVLAPDMRGYNRSEKPHGIDVYRLPTLADDVAAFVRTVNDAAHVVGHDWGGVVAWDVARSHPETVSTLSVLNAPHPVEYARELDLEQIRRSWYALTFQLPWLPERLLARRGFASLERLFREWTVRPDAFTDDDLARYRVALRQPGALESAINYYRAFARTMVRDQLPGAIPVVGDRLVEPVDRVDVPTLVCWGERDPALSLARSDGLEAYATDVVVERYPDAGHWVHLDAPGRVTERLLSSFSR